MYFDIIYSAHFHGNKLYTRGTNEYNFIYAYTTLYPSCMIRRVVWRSAASSVSRNKELPAHRTGTNFIRDRKKIDVCIQKYNVATRHILIIRNGKVVMSAVVLFSNLL